MNPEYEPKSFKQKLGYLVEECGEVLAAAGKTLRWGLDSCSPELPPERQETNEAWLKRELVDLERAVAYVREALTDDEDEVCFCKDCEARLTYDVERGERVCFMCHPASSGH